MFNSVHFISKRKIKIGLAIITGCLLLLTPVFAATGIGDIAWSAFSFIITGICKMILGGMQAIASLFLGAMDYDLQSLMNKGYFSGFTTFAYIIRVLATSLAILMGIWQFIVVGFGPMLGIQQQQSTGYTIMRMMVFIPLTYAVQPLAMTMLGEFQKIYSSFMSVYRDTNSGTIDIIPSGMNVDEFINRQNAAIPDVVDETWIRVISVVFSCFLLIIILFQFIQLVLEMAQRFVIMVFYVYLSPLAVACGVSPGASQIAKSAFSLFISSGILWVMNVWSISVIMGLFSSFPEALSPDKGGSPSAFFLLVVIAYAAIKIAQQLDDIFNAVGASNVRLSGSMFSDLLSLGKIADFGKSLGKTIGKAREEAAKFGKNGFFGGKEGTETQGNTPDNPITPDANKKINSGTGNADGTGRGIAPPPIAKKEDGTEPRSYGGQIKDKILDAGKNTIPGQLASGFVQTTKNVAANVKNSVSEEQMARSNKAVSDFHKAFNTEDAAERAKAISKLSNATLNDPAVKDYVSNAMGLGENQRLEGLSKSADGQLSGVVSTENADGSTQLSHVSGITNAVPGDGSAGASTMPTGAVNGIQSATYSPRNLDESSKTGTQSVGYTDIYGDKQTATIAPSDARMTYSKNTKPQKSFMAESSNGEKFEFTAPANMSTSEVASMVAGTASPETLKKFNDGEGDMCELSRLAGKFSMDTDESMTVHSGQAFENSMDTNVVLTNESGKTMTMSRVGSHDYGDTWKVTDAQNNELGTVSVPNGLGAREVVDYVRTSHDEGAKEMRSTVDMGSVKEIQFRNDNVEIEQTPVHAPNQASWDNDFRAELRYAQDFPNDPIIKVNYAQAGEDGHTFNSQVSFVPVSTNGNVATYQVVSGGEIIQEFKCPRNGGIEDVVSSLPMSDSALGENGPITDLRRKLGMKTSYSELSVKDSITETMRKARQSKKGTSQNPVNGQ